MIKLTKKKKNWRGLVFSFYVHLLRFLNIVKRTPNCI